MKENSNITKQNANDKGNAKTVLLPNKRRSRNI